MRVIEWCRRLQPSQRNQCIIAVIVLLGLMGGQVIKNSRLRAEVARFQVGQSALLRERASLIQTSDLWKAEAIAWREKSGYIEPPIVAPSVNDKDREPIGAPP